MGGREGSEHPLIEERVKSLLKDISGSVPKEIWSGRLTKISEIGPLERDIVPVNPVFGPGGLNSIRKEQFGSYTRFHVAGDDEEKEFQYDGAIFPDSIGNLVEVYELRRRILVHDRDLQRWYR